MIVTSTLCEHSGTPKIKYPRVPLPAGLVYDGEDEEEMEEEESEDNESDAGRPGSQFFTYIKEDFILSQRDVEKRRHVRFFHVCACTEEETDIQRLIAEDPAYTVSGRKPNELEVRELHRTAYRQLVELLHSLEIRTTPCMLFFVRNQRLRYSLMHDPAPENKVRTMGVRDNIIATGCNFVKWKRIFMNAVVVRNEMLKEYDAEIRELARLAKKEARRLERAERKRRKADEETEEEEEEYEY